jgi:hypothetical protein
MEHVKQGRERFHYTHPDETDGCLHYIYMLSISLSLLVCVHYYYVYAFIKLALGPHHVLIIPFSRT